MSQKAFIQSNFGPKNAFTLSKAVSADNNVIELFRISYHHIITDCTLLQFHSLHFNIKLRHMQNRIVTILFHILTPILIFICFSIGKDPSSDVLHLNQNNENVILNKGKNEIITTSNEIQEDNYKNAHEEKYCKEIPMLFYRKNKFPKECLGPGSLCITPQIKDDVHMKIWIWIHPAIFQEFYRELKEVNNTHDVDMNCQMDVDIELDFPIRNNNDTICLNNNISVDDTNENSSANNSYKNVRNIDSNNNDEMEDLNIENNHDNCSNHSNSIKNIDDENIITMITTIIMIIFNIHIYHFVIIITINIPNIFIIIIY